MRSAIQGLKAEKDTLKEQFYKQLLEYEKQQMELRRIEWMKDIKGKVLEREEQKRQWEEEKGRRQEERKKWEEEEQRREDMWRKREEERVQKEEEKQKKWEEYML